MSLRFRYRHVHQTCADYLKSGLADLGWVNDPVNFGADPLRFITMQPEEEGLTIVPPLVSITMGDEPQDELEELGGGMWSISLPLFVDIYGQSGTLSICMAQDVKSLITRNKVIPVTDYTDPNNPVESAELLYFENVYGPEKPNAAALATDVRRHWRIVKAMCQVYYGG